MKKKLFFLIFFMGLSQLHNTYTMEQDETTTQVLEAELGEMDVATDQNLCVPHEFISSLEKKIREHQSLNRDFMKTLKSFQDAHEKTLINQSLGMTESIESIRAKRDSISEDTLRSLLIDICDNWVKDMGEDKKNIDFFFNQLDIKITCKNIALEIFKQSVKQYCPDGFMPSHGMIGEFLIEQSVLERLRQNKKNGYQKCIEQHNRWKTSMINTIKRASKTLLHT